MLPFVQTTIKHQEADLANKNLKDELRRLDEEEARIKEQRAKLHAEAKAQALAAAEAALSDLNALGYAYKLVEGGKTSSAARPSGQATAGGRRTGIRESVMSVVAEAGTKGIAPAAIRAKLGIEGRPVRNRWRTHYRLSSAPTRLLIKTAATSPPDQFRRNPKMV